MGLVKLQTKFETGLLDVAEFIDLARLVGGDKDFAAGVLVNAHRVAQICWDEGRKSVPNEVWVRTVPHGSAIIGSGYAAVVDDGIYVKGTAELVAGDELACKIGNSKFLTSGVLQ